jgi:hypothetical protein
LGLALFLEPNMGMREFLKSKPSLGWGLAGALVLVGAWVWYRSLNAGSNITSVDRMAQEITIKDRETGEEWTIARGRMELYLWERKLPIDPNEGLPNPKTGKLTGFPKSEWESTVDRITSERELTAETGGRKSTSAPKEAK